MIKILREMECGCPLPYDSRMHEKKTTVGQWQELGRGGIKKSAVEVREVTALPHDMARCFGCGSPSYAKTPS